MICACTGNLCENECVNLEKRAKLDSPKNFQAISGNASVLLTWDKVDNADYKYVLSYEKNEIEILPDVG